MSQTLTLTRLDPIVLKEAVALLVGENVTDSIVMVPIDGEHTVISRVSTWLPWTAWDMLAQDLAAFALREGIRRVALLAYSEDGTDDTLLRHVVNVLVDQGIVSHPFCTTNDPVEPLGEEALS